MRHGERMDKTYGMERLKTAFRSCDPPITTEGQNQAFATGMMIVAYKFQIEHRLNQGRPFDRIVIESSPFIRTMQTCAKVCKALHIDSFRINYELCEHLEPRMRYGEDPIPALTIRQFKAPGDKEAFRRDYL